MSEALIRKTLTMSAEEQKREIQAAGETPIFSYNQYLRQLRTSISRNWLMNSAELGSLDVNVSN